MSDYRVNTEQLQEAYNKLIQILSDLDTASCCIREAHHEVTDMTSVAIQRCTNTIAGQSAVCVEQWNNLQAIAGYLMAICDESDKAEQDAAHILDMEYELTEDMLVEASTEAKSGDGLLTLDNLKKYTQKVVGKCDIVGTVISSAWMIHDDDSDLNIFKQLNKITNRTAGEILKQNSKVAAKNAVKSKKKWSEAFSDEIEESLSDYTVGKYDNGFFRITEEVRCATEWADVAFEGLARFSDNMEEYSGDFSNLRMYEETVVETVLSIGVDSIVKAAVSATVVATLGVGAPGLVVAAATVGASMFADYAMDWCSKLITGNDDGWLENASDALINISHAVKEKKMDFIGSLGDMLGKGVSTISNGLFTVWAT